MAKCSLIYQHGAFGNDLPHNSLDESLISAPFSRRRHRSQFPPSAVSPRAPGSPNSASQNNFGAHAVFGVKWDANGLDLRWLVVWNMNVMTFDSVGNVILPTASHLSEG